jgi:arylsulfatase A-like enzyme
MIHRITAAALLLSLLVVPSLAQDAPAADPGAQAVGEAPRARRALIISVDGLRPDLLLRANTPNMHALFESGSFSFWARTTEVSITLPSHTSMVTGVVPKKHGIHFNDDGPEEQVYPNVPTLFELAKKQGYTTSLVSGKSKFMALTREVDFVSVPPRKKGRNDKETAEAAVEIIKSNRPDIMYLHLAGVDGKGHGIGWGSPAQMKAIAEADEALGVVFNALREAGLFDQTLIILSADHGGAGRWHGRDDARARHIPWIAVGPGIRKNHDLTMYREVQINTEDTFATACYFLGIPLPEDIDGKPIQVVLEDYNLMQDATTKPATQPTTAPTATAR